MDNVNLFPCAEKSEEFFSKLQVPERQPVPMSMLGLMSAEGLDDETGEVALMTSEGPTILTFADKLSADKRQMAKDATLFAEMVANTSGNIQEQPLQWLAAYREAMLHAGWFMASSDRQSYNTSKRDITMDSVVLEIVASVSGGNAAAMIPLVSRALDKLKGDEDMITLFNNNSTGATKDSCRILPCLETPNGEAVTLFIGLEYNRRTDNGGALFWKWDVETMDITQVATMVNWNERVYQRNKEEIHDYMGVSSDNFFKKIKRK
ncbi:hypothetical protein [Pseudomonas aegrilactucae]|uniref:Uncharacterized protein n=1 Tax=Pseudomonas aegrilactucae TaxID=2854028 RepID=A0A9Q3ADN1_9PSED|nr:hypothetical protein [Pseudomonas aegrilactucae]MBV6286535.1 hypothetical protein [Pseudomonas aegrilactucae]